MNFIKGRKYQIKNGSSLFTIQAQDNFQKGIIVDFSYSSNTSHALGYEGETWVFQMFKLLPQKIVKFKLLKR